MRASRSPLSFTADEESALLEDESGSRGYSSQEGCGPEPADTENIPAFLFDPQDHELLAIMDQILHRKGAGTSLKTLFDPSLHANGIKEMAASKELRIAYAVIHLLDSLEAGLATDRLDALRSVRDEVLHCAQSGLRYNTARVLLQIMKELVRARGDLRRRLELAHDFRMASTGKPRVIRAQLTGYHLLEMPEEWNQESFDDHIHDANTKGRKSPTHLIMDAWIKGIRSITVIYYNYVRPEVAEELLEAAEIMGITVRIGVEFSARFRNRYVNIIWSPRGFSGAHDLLQFLAKPAVKELMTEGRTVSEYQRNRVLKVLRDFNETHLHTINRDFGIEAPPVDETDFLFYVGSGQASLLHLATFISDHLMDYFRDRVEELRCSYADSPAEERDRIARLVETMDRFDSYTILERYLRPCLNPNVDDPSSHLHYGQMPALMELSPNDLLTNLVKLHAGYRATLNLSGLPVEDVLEVLYDCRGMITHLEIFNLKDYVGGKTSEIPRIGELQEALNEDNVIRLKRVIRGVIRQCEREGNCDPSRVEKLREILHDIRSFHEYYRKVPLKSRIGSDSTGRSSRVPGMGLVIKETLPHRSRREIEKSLNPQRKVLPVFLPAYRRVTSLPREIESPVVRFVAPVLRKIPLLSQTGITHTTDWVVDEKAIRIGERGNIVPLGGIRDQPTNGLSLFPRTEVKQGSNFSWRYLHTGLKSSLKVLIGFIPAFLTFLLTKDWWLLTYFGAVIWFGITGVRNVIQAVLAGRGLTRSSVLTWRNYVSWERLADSLFYTGFSVPLLDYLVKTLMLDRGFGITAHTNPLILYAVIALANGAYISGHNAYRGLPRGAIIGNLFRSIFSVPLALIFNAVAGLVLMSEGIPNVDVVLQKWAAIISKAASDCMAAVIEGAADRFRNISIRRWDYRGKLAQLFDTYSDLELLFPDADVLEMLASPKTFIITLNAKARDLEKKSIINALDLLYFWMYQPRARGVLRALVRNMSREERQILQRSQLVLMREREISQMFVDGIVGRNFPRPLAFYLNRSGEYLTDMQRMVQEDAPPPPAGHGGGEKLKALEKPAAS